MMINSISDVLNKFGVTQETGQAVGRWAEGRQRGNYYIFYVESHRQIYSRCLNVSLCLKPH